MLPRHSDPGHFHTDDAAVMDLMDADLKVSWVITNLNGWNLPCGVTLKVLKLRKVSRKDSPSLRQLVAAKAAFILAEAWYSQIGS